MIRKKIFSETTTFKSLHKILSDSNVVIKQSTQDTLAIKRNSERHTVDNVKIKRMDAYLGKRSS